MEPISNKKLTLDQLLAVIRDGHFLESIFVLEINWDERLDARDTPSFDEAWSDSYKRLNDNSSQESEKVGEIRELAFKETYKITENPDLAGYVSDDLGLIAKALECHVEDPFITQLWEAYAQGIFPGPK